jgi:glutamate-1-semialdehyde 2,1-aminomutase
MFEILALGSAAALALAPAAKRRVELSRAKHPSLAGHVRLAKRVAKLVPACSYDDGKFFNADDAAAEVVARRRAGMHRLAELYAQRFQRGTALTQAAREVLSDLQFTSAYRVPFQFSRVLREHLKFGNVMASSQDVTLTDPDGNVFFDLTGSYGVNVFGYDFYKSCIAEGSALVQDLGPVLGALHPCVVENVEALRRISGLDEVSFHMSGTEAVMQAVRLARYHTRRTHLVRFSGAYHGWWDDVQPGPGNPSLARCTYTLREMHDETLRVLRSRKDIACVLVNPVQALHPNANPPADSALVDSGRWARYDRAAYTDWLVKLRQACDANGIVLIFDEVLVGFRLAAGGAQEYFGVRADLVTYGKTIAGGLPVGVVCGRRDLMKRFREDRPADVCLARGTFNSHPYVMGAMHVFLQRLQRPEVRALYDGLDATWNTRAEALNRQLEAAAAPVRVAGMGTLWTVTYTAPSRYNWMLQFYLRAEGLALSWVGTGRILFSLNTTQSDFDEVAHRFVAAARAMHSDGWWEQAPALTNKAIRRGLLAEMLRQRF